MEYTVYRSHFITPFYLFGRIGPHFFTGAIRSDKKVWVSSGRVNTLILLPGTVGAGSSVEPPRPRHQGYTDL